MSYKKTARTHVVGIRIDSETKDRLQRFAAEQNRTLSNLLATICRDYNQGVFPPGQKTATT